MPAGGSAGSRKNRRGKIAVRLEDGFCMGRSGPGARRSRSVLAVLIIVAAILLPGCTSSPAGSKTKPEADSSKTASITQFYARDPQLPKGEKTVLCYGVAG